MDSTTNSAKSHCHINIPFSTPCEVSRAINKLSTNAIEPDSEWPWSMRLINYLEEIGDDAESWVFTTIIRDPIQRMCQIHLNWSPPHGHSSTWDSFMDDPENQRNCYRAFDYYVGEYDDVHVGVIPIENPDEISDKFGPSVVAKMEQSKPFSHSEVPEWAAHMICQFNQFEAQKYGYDILPPTCKNAQKKSIVIVGSHKCLLSSSLGETIDQHDLVLRVNNAPIGGFESHVGSRTDIVMLNAVITGGTNASIKPENISDAKIADRAEIWHVPSFPIRGCYKYKKGYIPILATHALYEKIETELLKRPTTGLIAIMAAATHGFSKISIAGFGELGAENTYSHYYEDNTSSAHHNFIGENELLRHWIDSSLITSLDF